MVKSFYIFLEGRIYNYFQFGDVMTIHVNPTSMFIFMVRYPPTAIIPMRPRIASYDFGDTDKVWMIWRFGSQLKPTSKTLYPSGQ
jgi:hypothetical protein